MEYVVEITKEEIKGNKEIAQALLVAKSPFFVDTTIEVDEDNIRIKSEVLGQYDDYNKIMLLNLEDKLRYLINLSKIYTDLESSKYTYRFDKESIVFTENGIPLLVYRGVVNQVYPYDRISYEEFLNQYKAIAISIIDVKADYDKLAVGALEFYRGNLFCEKIAKEATLDGVVNVLSDFYNKEKQDNIENYTRVTRKNIKFLKTSIFITGIATIVLGVFIGYMLLYSIPQKDKIADIRLSFINKDYSNVIEKSKKMNRRSISQEDKYIVAYSVIQSEPLTEKQKERLSKINNQSNADYLSYWILIGQAKIDEAIDVASFLDDPQLLMYGITKKIDELQRNPELSSEKRTEQLNSYKSKLDELKKKYLGSEEEIKKDDKK